MLRHSHCYNQPRTQGILLREGLRNRLRRIFKKGSGNEVVLQQDNFKGYVYIFCRTTDESTDQCAVNRAIIMSLNRLNENFTSYILQVKIKLKRLRKVIMLRLPKCEM
jgi:hypothetical protein